MQPRDALGLVGVRTATSPICSVYLLFPVYTRAVTVDGALLPEIGLVLFSRGACASLKLDRWWFHLRFQLLLVSPFSHRWILIA